MTILDAPRQCFGVDGALFSREQERFLALHARQLVTRWQWVFRGGTLVASTEHGHGATISHTGFVRLINAGLVEQIGSAGVRLTDAGREAARQ